MGYLKKGGTIANPAKKSLTVFQNSQQVFDHYDIAYGTRTVYRNETRYGEQASFSMTAEYGGLTIRKTSNFPQDCIVRMHDQSGRYANVNISNSIPLSYGLTGQVIGIDGWVSLPAGWVGINATTIGKASTAYTVQVPDHTEQYEVSRTPVYRTDWNTKWRKLSA